MGSGGHHFNMVKRRFSACFVVCLIVFTGVLKLYPPQHPQNTHGTPWEYSRTYPEHPRNPLGILPKHPQASLGTPPEHSQNTPEYPWNTPKTPPEFRDALGSIKQTRNCHMAKSVNPRHQKSPKRYTLVSDLEFQQPEATSSNQSLVRSKIHKQKTLVRRSICEKNIGEKIVFVKSRW